MDQKGKTDGIGMLFRIIVELSCVDSDTSGQHRFRLDRLRWWRGQLD
jgi:hypothetical protein